MTKEAPMRPASKSVAAHANYGNPSDWGEWGDWVIGVIGVNSAVSNESIDFALISQIAFLVYY